MWFSGAVGGWDLIILLGLSVGIKGAGLHACVNWLIYFGYGEFDPIIKLQFFSLTFLQPNINQIYPFSTPTHTYINLATKTNSY